ncbi:MAG: GH92 family glycosyl hydrolase [bacterium]
MRRCWLMLWAMLAVGCDDDGGATPPAPADAGLAADAAPDPGPDAGPDPGPDAAPDAAPPGDAGPDAAPWPDPGPVLTADEALTYVDPFIGTGGTGFGYAAMTPAAQVPNGMARPGPDTTRGGNHVGFHHFSGYHHPDPDVRGFSHIRLVGTGVADLGLIRVLPQATLDGPPPGERYAPLDKATEAAAPGRYAVRLADPDVQVELTASAHAAAHRYTFAADGRVWIVIDAGASIEDVPPQGARIAWRDGRITGAVDWNHGFTGRSQGFTVSFDGTVDPPPAAVHVWDGSGFVDAAEVEGPTAALALGFDDVADRAVELRLGLSYIDGAQAEHNRVVQLADRGFDDIAAAARAAWRDKLGRVRVAGGSERQRRIFYTALYHAYAMPTRFGEDGGRYRGLDGEVHAADGFTYYTDLSLWDSFRTLHPWYELTDPDLERDVLRSLMAMYHDGGSMPRWPANTSYSGSMIGTSADMLFAGGQAKGIDGIDYDAAFDALMVAAMGPTARASRTGIEDYIRLGYVPEEATSGSVSRTLEYAYSDAMLARLAAALGRPEASMLAARADAWRMHVDPETGFVWPRTRAGALRPVSPVAITMGDGPYVEGNAWHWRFSVLHDPMGLAEAQGGVDRYLAALDELFDRASLGKPGFSPVIPDVFYWHGNEPPLHVAFMYHGVGASDRVARRVRTIQEHAYRDDPAGLVGNDDGGTLSAWYLFTALGLYPIAGTDEYLLASPLFPRAEVDHADGTLRIEAWGAGSDVFDYTAATLGDEAIEGGRLTHRALTAGGVLRFQMRR